MSLNKIPLSAFWSLINRQFTALKDWGGVLEQLKAMLHMLLMFFISS